VEQRQCVSGSSLEALALITAMMDGWMDGWIVMQSGRETEGLDGSNVLILPWLCCFNVIVIPVFKQATATFCKVSRPSISGATGVAGTTCKADVVPNNQTSAI
jgi:hypothetical protein